MHKAVLFTILVLWSWQGISQRNTSSTYFGIQSTLTRTAYQPIPKHKLGFTSFSYGASLERRFSLRNQLKFSYNYALNYLRFSPPQPTNSPSLTKRTFPGSELSAGIGVNAIYQFRKQSCVITGFSMNKPIYTCFKVDGISEDPSKPIIRNQETKFTLSDLNRWNAYFMIGLEQSMKLFKRELVYSLQYHFGFQPDTYFGGVQRSELIMTHGIQVGLKYNY